MRISHARRAVAVMMAVLSACGCLPALTMGGDFPSRARKVAERWQGSEEDRAWREGFVPLQSLALGAGDGRLPHWVAVSELNGVWTLEVDLPSRRPGPVVLNWKDGSTLTMPTVSAAAAFARLTRPRDFVDEKCPAGGCRPLRVIGAKMGEATMTTSRGRVRVPTWEFTVHGLRKPFRRIALDPAAMSAPPAERKGELREVLTYEPVTPHELDLRYGHGTCDTTHGARVYETAHVVVVDVDVRRDDVEICTAMMRIDRIRVKLGRALGDRIVLDSGNGLPVLRGTDVRLGDSYAGWDPRRS